MQVVGVNMTLSSGSYVGTINLAASPPASLGDPKRFLEWDFLIDADRNSLTHPWEPWNSSLGSSQALFENDVGVDYRAGLTLQGKSYQPVGAGLKIHFNSSGQITFESIELIIDPSAIGGSTGFDFIVSVREYAKVGDPGSLMVFDKAPNVGHYSFVGGVLTSTSEHTSSTSALTTSTTMSTASKSTSATAASTLKSTSTTTTESTSTIVLAVAYVIIALPFIGIIGLIIFLVRRRRRKGKTAEGLASKPSPAPVPTTEGTKFCTACGSRIPATTRFCASCGGKQD
jgi:hypothetical protein